MSAMPPDEQRITRILDGMTEDERDRTLRDLLRQQQSSGGDDVRKIEDANLLLRMRPKVKVTTYIPLTRRFAERNQDRKVWDLGIIDPLADEDIPGRPQIVRVESVPDGDVLFQRESVLGMPGVAEPVRVAIPPAPARRMQRPSSADLDEGTPPAPPPTVAGVQLPIPTGDEYEDGPGDGAGPTTVPVDPQVLTDMLTRLESLEAENTRLRAERAQADQQPPDAPEADDRPAKAAAAKRRGRPPREAPPGAGETPTEAKTPEPVGS